MTDKEVLEGLAARVEAASGADRELDAEIAVALKWGCRKNLPDDLEHLSAIRPDDYEASKRLDGCYWFHCRSGKSMRRAPEFTASLDAAASLIPEGWTWRAGCSRHVPHQATVHVAWGHGGWDGYSDHARPLALTAAALRALAAQGAEG